MAHYAFDKRINKKHFPENTDLNYHNDFNNYFKNIMTIIYIMEFNNY